MPVQFETRAKKLRNEKGRVTLEGTIQELTQDVQTLTKKLSLQEQKSALQDQKIAFQEQLIGELRTHVKGMQDTQSTFKAAFEKQIFQNRQLTAGDEPLAH